MGDSDKNHVAALGSMIGAIAGGFVSAFACFCFDFSIFLAKDGQYHNPSFVGYALVIAIGVVGGWWIGAWAARKLANPVNP